MLTMHQLAPLRHAPHLTKPGIGLTCQPRFLSPRLTWPGRGSVAVHSPGLGSRDSHMKPVFGRSIVVARRRGKTKFSAVQSRDEPGAGASIETVEGGNSWETNLADEDVRVLAKFRSLYNFVQVLEVSRRADHGLAGCKLLLLDRPGNIQSVYNPYKVITDSYYDVFATLPPLLPDGPVGILGLGAGTAARIIHYFWPHVELHGWELDPSVVMVARQFFDLSELEEGKRLDGRVSVFELEDDESSPGTSGATGRLVVHVGDALACQAPTGDGFAGLIVDMFSDGAVIPALQQPQTWQRLRQHLRPGGRIMVNCGGSCVEPDDKSAKDGETTMEETLEAMVQVFPDEIFQFKLPGKGNNAVALTGPSPDFQAWKQALPQELRDGVLDWIPVHPSH
ncbi:hypothetical protein KC19_9G119000 [Ceratodon purpureus]|uniref:S-adenosyl-L-methionine-dependent methyltransferase n=1 Tax=Ceratodon purpureus TaxID=3225 RepID=A0A8T0GSZ1_CERPU|nr:hypothetical protein KC19_9G119000 [Ceratodon purpureus]